jgi:hypothetical protein
MAQQASPQFLASFWNAHFPGQISDRLVIAEELTGNVIDLEGRDWSLCRSEIPIPKTRRACMFPQLAWS